jgi:hypothetical protein
MSADPKEALASLAKQLAETQAQLDELKKRLPQDAKVVTDWRLPSSLRLMDQMSMSPSAMRQFVDQVDERTMRDIRNDRVAMQPTSLAGKPKEG